MVKIGQLQQSDKTIGVLFQEDVKTQTTALASRNRKNRTNRTIADLLP